LAVSRWTIGVTTVIKTLAPFSFVTPPKTPPHKSLSQRTFGALKARTLVRAQSSTKTLQSSRENKNKKPANIKS
jgi:hypothetical protein